MNAKKILLIVGLVLVFITILYNQQLLFSVNYSRAEIPVDEKKTPPVKPVNSVEKSALHFIQNKMQNPGGLIYYAVQLATKDLYSVSESLGQAMEYSALIGDRKLLDYYAEVTEKYFKDPEQGYYYWKIDVNEKGDITGVDTSSALVDDLRLLRAYFIAHENKLGDYTAAIQKTADITLRFDFDKGYPCDYYDGKYREKAKEVSLFYLDVETLKKMSEFDGNWVEPYKNTVDILLNIPEHKYGFYPILFRTDVKKYVWKPSTNMVENLYTALFAYHAGKDTRPFLDFLKKEMKHGKIYNHYHNSSGKEVNTDESSAVYALATRFFTLHNEREAAKWSYGRTMDFAISNKSKFHGGFGDEETGQVYAFDQLEVLLMLRTVEF